MADMIRDHWGDIARDGVTIALLRDSLAALVAVVENIPGDLSTQAWHALEDGRQALAQTSGNANVSVRMTRKQLEKLVDVLDETQDEGPYGKGWASPELSELRSLFGSELEGLKKA